VLSLPPEDHNCNSRSLSLSLSLSLSYLRYHPVFGDRLGILFDVNCYVIYLLQASPNGSACFILTPHWWCFVVTHNDAPRSVGFPWTRGQLVTETSTWQNTQHSQQPNFHTPGGIRTHDPSKRTAVDLSLRPRSHWDRLEPVTFRFVVQYATVCASVLASMLKAPRVKIVSQCSSCTYYGKFIAPFDDIYHEN